MISVIATGADISVYHLAARHYGDATQFYRIMDLNGLTDPMISGVVNLLIPDADPAPTDGVPPQ